VAGAVGALERAGALRAGRTAVLLWPGDGRDDRGPVPGFLGAMARRLGEAGLVVVRADTADPAWASATRGADVVVTAAGEPARLGALAVGPGAVVVDGGISRVDGRVVGDVALASVASTASFVIPMPGGLGPLTVAALLDHVVTAAISRLGPAG
jgi:5,10-methylene-tetrahydrofolate dehydrogenase/methenyl tetrahydrofolate cyclohydrolase